MDHFIVNKDSWHYRWLCFYETALDRKFALKQVNSVEWFENWRLRPGDFCQYMRRIALWPALRTGAIAAAYAVSYSLFSTVSMSGFAQVVSVALVLAAFALITAGFAAVFYGAGFLFKKTAASAAKSSFAHTAYVSWKDKFCPIIEYERDQK